MHTRRAVKTVSASGSNRKSVRRTDSSDDRCRDARGDVGRPAGSDCVVMVIMIRLLLHDVAGKRRSTPVSCDC